MSFSTHYRGRDNTAQGYGYRLLLNSFHKGSSGTVWELSDNGLTLEVGTNVEYASYANDAHWTCKKGRENEVCSGDHLDENGK